MTQSRPDPLVILGFDAGDPKWIRQWVEEGRLPTVRRIMERGCWGETGGRELLFEHGVWQVLFSGISRAQTGHHSFRQLTPGSYELALVTAADVSVPPFWNAVAGTDKSGVIVDVPDVLPVADINGCQIANWGVHRGWRTRHPSEQPMTRPQSLSREVAKFLPRKDFVLENARSTTTEDHKIYRQLLKQVARKGALCRHFIGNRDKPDIMVAIFGESHTGGHQFWKYSKSDRSHLNGSVELTDATRSVYEAIDREMGLLLEQLPSNANVFILSSLGLTDHYPTTGLMESFCRELGYQVPKSGDAGFSAVNLLRRSIPQQWRIAVSRHLSREKRERLLSQQFSTGTDWSKTTAFSVPSIYTGHIRVNLRGREPAGIVGPGEEYQNVLDRFESDLRQLVDDDGLPAIANVVRTATVFGVDPADGLPDLIVHWRPCSRFMNRVRHPRCELRQEPSEFNRDSDHYERGFIAAAGPAIMTRGALEQIDVLNLAPTFLHLIGSSKWMGMEGRILTELIQTGAAVPTA